MNKVKAFFKKLYDRLCRAWNHTTCVNCKESVHFRDSICQSENFGKKTYSCLDCWAKNIDEAVERRMFVYDQQKLAQAKLEAQKNIELLLEVKAYVDRNTYEVPYDRYQIGWKAATDDISKHLEKRIKDLEI